MSSKNKNKTLPKGWEVKTFEECLHKIPTFIKVPKKQFLQKGALPIISQENKYINGYWNNKEDIFNVDKPVIIFGDHTKNIKYIDFSFVVGADGVKVFLPTKSIISKFFYYQLINMNVKSLGYARHYRLLKEKMILIPPLAEQEKIVSILDKAFAKIDKMEANLTANIANAKALFQSQLNAIFNKQDGGWEIKTLGEVCEIFDNQRKPITRKNRIEGTIPYYGATGILSYVKNYIFDEQLVLLGEDGAKWQSGEKSAFIIKGKSWVNNHAHVIKPQKAILNDNWLVYNLNFQNLIPFVSGMTVPKLNQTNMKQIKIPLPPLAEQEKIIRLLDKLQEKTLQLEQNYQKELLNSSELKKVALDKAFKGRLV